jgi:hypothetical protein
MPDQPRELHIPEHIDSAPLAGVLRIGDIIVPIVPKTVQRTSFDTLIPAPVPTSFDPSADPTTDDFPAVKAPVFAPPTRRTIYTNDPQKRGF